MVIISFNNHKDKAKQYEKGVIYYYKSILYFSIDL